MTFTWAQWRWCAAMLGALSALAPIASAQYARDKQTFKLRGQEHKIFPRDKLVARGLTPPEIPDDQNAAWVYIDAINAFVDLPADLQDAQAAVVASGKWPEGDVGQRLSDWLDKNAETISLTRKATDMPQYYMPLVGNESDSIVSALLPTISPMREFARLMTVSAARERSAHPDAAVDDALALQQLAHHVAQGSTLIEGLVGIAIGDLAGRSLRWSIEDGNLSAEKLSSVSEKLDKLAATQPDFEKMLGAEEKLSECHIDDLMDVTRTLPGLFNPLGAFGEPIDRNPGGWQLLARRLKRVYLPDRLMKKHTRTYYDRLIAASRADEQGDGLRQTDEELLAAVPAWNMVGRMMLPSMIPAYERTQLRRANFERTRVAVAVAAYKKANGTYPPKLSDLKPTYLADIPKDPLSGREMEYAVSPDGASPLGLEPIDGDRMKAFYERRNAQAEARRAEAAHPWRILVKDFTDKYQFDEAQRTAADAIVRELEARAAAYVKSLDAKQMPDPAKEQELTKELTRRLEDLPTAAQRAAARK